MRRTGASDEKGFTLLEQLIVMAILGIVVTSMVTFFASMQKTTVRQSARGQTLDEIRLVLERITKESRQLTAVRSGSGASILDMDTYDNGVARRITYTASGTTLTRAVDGGTALPILRRLASTDVFTFTPSVTSPTDITFHVQARPEHYASDGAIYSLSAEVELRNKG